MASIHVTEIQRLLAERGEPDASAWSPGGFFLEIRFDEPGQASGPADPEFANKVLSVECPFGSVVIQFDESGQLRSLDIS